MMCAKSGRIPTAWVARMRREVTKQLGPLCPAEPRSAQECLARAIAGTGTSPTSHLAPSSLLLTVATKSSSAVRARTLLRIACRSHSPISNRRTCIVRSSTRPCARSHFHFGPHTALRDLPDPKGRPQLQHSFMEPA